MKIDIHPPHDQCWWQSIACLARQTSSIKVWPKLDSLFWGLARFLFCDVTWFECSVSCKLYSQQHYQLLTIESRCPFLAIAALPVQFGLYPCRRRNSPDASCSFDAWSNFHRWCVVWLSAIRPQWMRECVGWAQDTKDSFRSRWWANSMPGSLMAMMKNVYTSHGTGKT